MSDLTHFDDAGASRMVDTSLKPETLREARAGGRIRMAAATLLLIKDKGHAKGDVLEVARLAGLPPQVIQRARQVLKQHERSERHNVAAETEAPLQLTMFTPLSQRILDRLQETDINSLTPLQALNLLEELQSEIKSIQGGKA